MRLWINPDEVMFGAQVLEHVRSVRVRRVRIPEGLVLSQLWSNPARPIDGRLDGIEPRDGELVTIDVVRDIVSGLSLDLVPGATETLSFDVATGRSDANRTAVMYAAMLTEVDARLVRDDRGIETLRFVA